MIRSKRNLILMFLTVLVCGFVSCIGEIDDFDVPTTTSGSSLCPTTKACGCSNKRKAQCNTVCCKWTVGKGCGCK